MRSIAFTGFMGSGKSKIGKLVADRTGRPLIDLDHRISSIAGKTISEIFKDIGEEGFRDLEQEALMAEAGQEDTLVACGGGVVLREANRHVLRDSFEVVFLDATVDVLVRRLSRSSKRPLLEVRDREAVIGRMYDERRPLYLEVADHVIPTGDAPPQRVADQVILRLGLEETNA